MKDPAEFEISGIRYKAMPIDAITQFHIARRLAPLLPALQTLSSSDESAARSSLAVFSDVLSKMPEDDLNYILAATLSRVYRQKAGETGWAKLWSDNAKVLLFQDLQFSEMLMITVQVIGSSLGNFMGGLLLNSGGAAVPESASNP